MLPGLILNPVHTILQKFAYPCTTRHADFFEFSGEPHLKDVILQHATHIGTFITSHVLRIRTLSPVFSCKPSLFQGISAFSNIGLVPDRGTVCVRRYPQFGMFLVTTVDHLHVNTY